MTEIEKRWGQVTAMLRTGKVAPGDVTACYQCGGPAMLGPEVSLNADGEFEIKGLGWFGRPSLEYVPREIRPCSRCAA